jgi:uncharacterized protein (DUF302 family)
MSNLYRPGFSSFLQTTNSGKAPTYSVTTLVHLCKEADKKFKGSIPEMALHLPCKVMIKNKLSKVDKKSYSPLEKRKIRKKPN